MKNAALIFLTFFLAVSGQTYFTWNGGNGIWEDPSKWTPTGYPNSGSHRAVINAAGNYTITHRRFVLAGEIVVSAPGATLVLDSSIGFLIDSSAVSYPTVSVFGNTLPGHINVTVRNEAVDNTVTTSVSAWLTNLETGQTFNLTLSATSVPGTWALYNFPVVNCQNATSAQNANEMEATAFDTLRADYYFDGTRYYGYTQMLYTDSYQSRLGFNTIGRVLFTRSLEKNLKSLTHLRAKLQFILANLPPYADNHCCQDDSYIYPLNLTALAIASYRFLTGGPSGNYTTCTTTIGEFCSYVDFQYGNAIGPVTIQWTGLGDTNSWQDKNNWYPRVVPDYPNADVRVWTQKPTWVHLEDDVQIRSLKTSRSALVNENHFFLSIGTGAPLTRKYWYGGSGAWENSGRWWPRGAPTDTEIATTGGFGAAYLSGDVTVAQRLDTGASQDGEQMIIEKKGFSFTTAVAFT